MENINPGAVDAYANDCMGMFIPTAAFDFMDVEHVHRGYEFVIPFRQSSPYKVEKKLVATEQKKIFPFNPEQSHRAMRETSTELVAVFLETDFLQSLAKSIYGKQSVSFVNRSHTYSSNLKNLLFSFMDELKHKQAGCDFITQSIAVQAGIRLLRELQSNCSTGNGDKRYSHKKGINAAVEFIHENYRQDFTLNEIAQVAYLSPYHFSRAFKAELGKSPFDYLLDVKIEIAKELLKLTDKTVTDICFESGFNDPSHFSRVFSRRVGLSPISYRKQLL